MKYSIFPPSAGMTISQISRPLPNRLAISLLERDDSLISRGTADRLSKSITEYFLFMALNPVNLVLVSLYLTNGITHKV
jgi:hypothetical protein